MKGLKNKMSIKAFCKRGLAIMLACAMVAPGVGSVMQTQAADIPIEDEWIPTTNGLEVKISAQYHGANGAGIMAGAEQNGKYATGTASTADIRTLVDGKIDTGVIFRGALDDYPDGLEVGDYIQVDFKEPITFTGITFTFQQQGTETDFFNDSTLTYTTDGSTWNEFGKIASAKIMSYQADGPVENVKAIKLTNNVYERAWVALREITVKTLISPVYEKYVPGSNTDAYVEDGTYVIVGAHKNVSLNKAVNSGETLTYTDVAGNIQNDILTRLDEAYEWVITKEGDGYKLSAADDTGYFNITSSDSATGATVKTEPQVVTIRENTNYAGSVAIGANGGYLNHRGNTVGTWTQADQGSSWYLYKFGYKISDMFVPALLLDVREQELYTEESWRAYESAKAEAEAKLTKLYATEDAAKTVYEEVCSELEAAVELLDMMIIPVGEKCEPDFSKELCVEDGIYAIVGARVGADRSENKAITSTMPLTYTPVAAKMQNHNDILMLPEKGYLWAVKSVEGGYNLSPITGDGFLKITNVNDQHGATVAQDAQLINIFANEEYENSATIGSKELGGYLNDRSGYPGTWNDIDLGSAWYLYKLAYKVSETFVLDAINGVEDNSLYTEESWRAYESAKAAAEKVFATIADAKSAYDTLVATVASLEKRPVILVTAGSVRDDGRFGPDGKIEKDPCRILDGNRENNWLSDPDDAIEDSWVNFELPKAKIVDGLKLYYGSGDYVHKGYEVLVSVDGAKWTKVCEGTFARTSGEKTIRFKPVEAKHIRLVPIAKYNKEFAIWEAEILYADAIEKEWFIGGSLRMDYVNDPTDPYGKTCLRFEYVFPAEFNGMAVDTKTVKEDGDSGSWRWNYGTTENMGTPKDVADGKWQTANGLVKSNIVFTNIGKANYASSLYTQITVTYSDATGANTLTVYDNVVAERSVNTVATRLEQKHQNAVDEDGKAQYNYAVGILGASAQ